MGNTHTHTHTHAHTHADTRDSVCPVVTEKHSWIGLVEVKTERERERERLAVMDR